MLGIGRWVFGVLLLCSLFAAGCASNRGPVQHIVVLWLKEPGNAEAQQQLVHASKSLRRIPGVRKVRVGTMLPSKREIVDSTFDVALVMTFKDEATMKAYLSHPTHANMVQRTLMPLVKKIQVYDFVEQ